MLFVPPSISSMIPEVEAAQVRDKGDFITYYVPLESGSELEKYEKLVKSSKYLEKKVKWLNSTFKLPRDVYVAFLECGFTNAFYVSSIPEPEPTPKPKQKAAIVICYEYVEKSYEMMEYLVTPGKGDMYIDRNLICKSGKNCPSAETRMINLIDYVLYHELGHAVIDLYKLPLPAAQEDMADSLSSYVLLKFLKGDVGVDSIRNAAWAYMLQSSVSSLDNTDFADEHSLDIQRFHNLACFAYGSNPSSNRDLVGDGLLTKDRSKRCTDEYKNLVSSWDKLLVDHLQNRSYTPAPIPPSIPSEIPIPQPSSIPPPPPPTPPTPNAELGTVSIEKPVLEIPYRVGTDSRADYIKISGHVFIETRGHSALLILTDPSGKTSELKIPITRDGYWTTKVGICCNNVGKWTVQAFWSQMFDKNYFGMVEFQVVLKPKSQPTTTPTPTPTPEPEPTSCLTQPGPTCTLPYFGSLVELDKVYYKQNDVVNFLIVTPSFNADSRVVDYIGTDANSRVTIITSQGTLDFYKLKETGVDTGVFEGSISLNSVSKTGTGPWSGNIKTSNKDTITVQFSNTYSGNVDTVKAQGFVEGPAPTPKPEPTPEPKQQATTQESVQNVPDWVRNIFIWYGEEKISEDELLSAIKFLVNQGIINLE